jgi:hypothetical protein
MMNPLLNSSKIVMLAMALLICVSGCKSSKKAAEAARASAEKARIEQEATLKRQEEDQKKQEAAEQASREADAKRQHEQQEEAKESTPVVKLNQYFDAIVNSANLASANSSINEALGLFVSPEAPVLIVISGSGDQKDYDRPTTIKSYLNYLKDQKKNLNKIEKLEFDNAGKITVVELRKN